VALESPVEPAADEAWGVACHLGVAGAALAVVFAAALCGVQVAEQALGGGGGLEWKGQRTKLWIWRWKMMDGSDVQSYMEYSSVIK